MVTHVQVQVLFPPPHIMKTNKDKEYSFIHVNGRLDERFGVDISMPEFESLSESFKNDKSTRITVENKQQEVHRTRFKGKYITFVFNTEKGHITTALVSFNKDR